MDRRLIEEELPLATINAESGREKSAQKGHISAMHLWWARRPLAMSRAVVFGSLFPDPGSDVARDKILAAVAAASPFKASVREELIGPLRRLLRDATGDSPPRVLDCFAGGGAIPLEALRLGCDTTAVDLNPVAHLIERCALEFPQVYGQMDPSGKNVLADDFAEWAEWVRGYAEPLLSKVFPTDSRSRKPAIYFWARTMSCPNPTCGLEMPLVSSFWIARSTRRTAWAEWRIEDGRVNLEVRTGPPPKEFDPSRGTVKASSATCLGCGTSLPAKAVRATARAKGFGHRLYAVADIEGRVRGYRSPREDEVEGAQTLATALLDTLPDYPEGTTAVPDEPMVKSQYRIYCNLIYGIDSFRGLFTNRQLYVHASLCQAVRAAHEEMLEGGMDSGRARVTATYLALCVDRITAYNSTHSSAHVTLEAIRDTFPQQSIRSVWDFVEIDPLGEGPGNWTGAVQWVESAIRHCATTGSVPATVIRADAQELPFPASSFDAVVIDPPYYDAVQYGDLSDYFYVWLKRSVGHLYPDLFATPLTPKSQEIIENRADKKSNEFISHEEFERRLQKGLDEVARVVKPDGVVTIVFAHTDVEAWERLLRALRSAGLVVSTSWPMRSESANKTKAKVSAVLGSSVVLVCRRQQQGTEGFYDDVVRDLEARIAERLDIFEDMGLRGADYFISAIGPAFEVFAQHGRVVRLSGEEVDVSELLVLARRTVARHAMRRLLGDESVQSLDSISLLYLTWRWAYGSDALPGDEAYKMERAFDVDLSSLSGPYGLVDKTGSNFGLRGPDERKGLKLAEGNPGVVDVLHKACQLWDSGGRRELEAMLAESGMVTEASFWALARALAEVLPEGDRERTMLLGLTGNQEGLTHAAVAEHMKPEQPKML